jgi:hypothetical protein
VTNNVESPLWYCQHYKRSETSFADKSKTTIDDRHKN